MALMLAFGFGVALGLATMYALCDLALAEPGHDERGSPGCSRLWRG